MNLLVGSKGFVGAHLLRGFHENNIPVRGVDMPEYDIRTSPSAVLENVLPGDVVIHAVHFGSIDACKQNPVGTASVNVEGTTRFFQEVKKRQAIPLYFSTNMVFDGSVPFYSEHDIPRPSTEYGRQKYTVEQYVQSEFPQYIICRMTKVYGTTPGDGSMAMDWGRRLARGERVRAITDMYSAPVHIDDVVSSVISLLQRRYSGICHFSGPIERSLYEIACFVATSGGFSVEVIDRVALRDMGLVENRSVHNSLACSTLEGEGYRLPRDISEMLSSIIF